jgi:hypothetical protein
MLESARVPFENTLDTPCMETTVRLAAGAVGAAMEGEVSVRVKSLFRKNGSAPQRASWVKREVCLSGRLTS